MGIAYECFCSKDELEEARQEALRSGKQPVYSGKCRELSEKERAELKNKGIKPAIRFHVMKESVVVMIF